ncbi:MULTISPECIES: phycobilisome rod-core linker polypeptide [unclassified Nostoc]|uniref:phycobilisome rod-core linker polypeptide n=1 Tax=unclassified Nostoc TaxID=2593658 RepID=UPI000A3A4783|nr:MULTISPECIES: phycobilisome rod-core linker polypeptide [unclassified Nostoc]OUL26677.1 phycobilisome rod-core linker polypeptide CpcG1 [Nostoc sp. T09]OUL31054.1 phycobilisome rod-core linker polypeptide CpcG1 [Nostoc sp. RF31YmG]OUL35317.1 phycobilisome rod-core linker polypeptide CpcG1 [Nostoc sp. 106C]
MSIPLLEYSPTTQNQRVEGYEVPNEDTPINYRLADATSDKDIDGIIWAAYRQIFSEHLIIQRNRQKNLESQLRNRAINVRDFIRGLGKSEVYRTQVADLNSNYRLVDITLKRFLGRAAYNKDEEIAWSIVIGTKGLHGFIDALLDSDEYRQNFGDDIVPFQRRRFKDRPFNLVNPRYASYWRDRQTLTYLGGRSFYQARTSGSLTKEDIRQAIPSNFLALAGQILPNERNYQRTIATVTSQIKNIQIPDNSREPVTEQPTVKPTAVALPYRYIPGNRTT